MECEHWRADGLDVEGMKSDVYDDKGQVVAVLLMRWRKAGTGWDQELCFGHTKFQVFLRSPRREATWQLDVRIHKRGVCIIGTQWSSTPHEQMQALDGKPCGEREEDPAEGPEEPHRLELE